jgi:ribosomal protein L18E
MTSLLLLLALAQAPTDAEIWRKVANNLAAPTWYDPAVTAAAIAAQGTTAPATVWALESGTLPPGTALGIDGRLTGTPTAAGTFTFTIRATIKDVGNVSRQFVITIAPAIVIDPAPPPGRVGVAYSFQFAAQEK